jgi:murein DD-endopeptidase MepM/ murein hydrolase activator NlpD
MASIAVVMANPVFGQIAFAEPSLPEVEIPVEPITEQSEETTAVEEEKANRTLDYTEDLWDVTDVGIFDTAGSLNDSLTEEQQADQAAQQTTTEEDSIEAYKQSIIESWGGKKAFAEKRLEGVKENLSDQMKRFVELEKKVAEAQEKLSPIKEEAQTLENYIRLLNTQIQDAKEKITNTEILIAEKKIQIKDLMLNLKKSEIEMDIQKKIVTDYVKLLYNEEQQYFNLYDNGSSTVKLLLADASVSENLLGQEYMQVMEETGRKVFYDLEKSHRELTEKQKTILNEQSELEFLYNELLKEKRSLEETRTSKKDLLAETKGEEDKYQQLLEQSIQEQLETAISIQNLQENIDVIESKLDTLDEGLDSVQKPAEEAPVAEQTAEQPSEVIKQVIPENEEKTKTPFIWPVPANKINAYFHDPTYPKKWGVHNAIDIRAKQFTEIIAPANGYVFQTKDNGNGYSYIILAHKNNLVTVYGHVTEIFAKPGTIVKKGDVIGLSGGTPGTKGAGLQTTGPHLHFEVYYKGDPVNPLDYLPIDEMPIEYVPDEYLKELK